MDAALLSESIRRPANLNAVRSLLLSVRSRLVVDVDDYHIPAVQQV